MSVDRDSWLMVSNLLEIVDEIKESHRIADDVLSGGVRDMVLYDDEWRGRGIELAHYTSWEKLLKIFEVHDEECPVLRMYNCETANDPEEGKEAPIPLLPYSLQNVRSSSTPVSLVENEHV